jgi:hypothetical protein
MEKPKRKEKTQAAQEARAQIKFAAPYSLADCLYRLRDTKRLEPGFISAGIDPTFEKVDAITYRFKVRRTWYDFRWRRHSSYIEVRGYLRALDNGTTMVIGKVRVSPLVLVVAVLFGLMLVASLAIPSPLGNDLFLELLSIGAIGVFAALVYFDRRTLIRLLHKTLGGDV